MKHLNMEGRKVLIVGFGSIGAAVLPLMLRHLTIDPSHISIVAADPINEPIAKKERIHFECKTLTEENYEAYLSKHLQKGDVLLNLSVGISSFDLIRFAQKHGILYLDTSSEVWTGTRLTHWGTVFGRRELILSYAEENPQYKTTALISHGANPGLVSHFLKKAILDIAARESHPTPDFTHPHHWASLARDLGIVAIHISEKDTQRSSLTRKEGEYANTWSIPGFLSEAAEPSGFAWGTHEKDLPKEQVSMAMDSGTLRIIELTESGGLAKVKTWAPVAGAFEGCTIPHAETYSIAQTFSLRDEKGECTYQPTVHFSYSPCQDAQDSVLDAAAHHWDQEKPFRILMDDVMEGVDELGVLVLRKNSPEVYWYGSYLDVNEARRLAPYNNATSLQVAIGVLAGLVWMVENPEEGVVEPDDIDFRRVLEIATPYLGRCEGVFSTWTGGDNQEYKNWYFSDLRVR